MKKNLPYFLLLLLATISCKVVDPFEGVELGTMGITSVTAEFTGELYENDPSASFSAQPDENNVILIEIPYYYPQTSDNEVSEDLLKNMRVQATLATGTYIRPAVGVMDLTQTHVITAYDSAGRTIEYELSAQITKSSDCVFESFIVTSNEVVYNGIISGNTISLLVTEEELTNCTVEYTVSAHATVSGYTEGMTIREGDVFTVTAHNGVDQTEYSISFSLPEKLSYGARAGSGRNLWTDYFSTMGITVSYPLRLAAQEDYLYILSAGSTIHQFNRKNGTYLGTVSLPTGYTVNSMVSDEAGNIIFANDAASGSPLQVYVLSSFDDTPRELINYTSSAGQIALGNIRVAGDVNSNAVITANYSGQGFGGQGRAWQITNGTAEEATTVRFGLGSTLWNTYNGCIAPASDNLSDGLFALGYWSYYDLYYTADFTSSTAVLTGIASANDNPNSISTATFNGARYLAFGIGAHFTYSAAPYFAVYESTSPTDIASAELYTAVYTDFKVGGHSGDSSTSSSDVLIVISEDGYYMDVYLVDRNYGILTCYEFDCIQQ